MEYYRSAGARLILSSWRQTARDNVAVQEGMCVCVCVCDSRNVDETAQNVRVAVAQIAHFVLTAGPFGAREGRKAGRWDRRNRSLVPERYPVPRKIPRSSDVGTQNVDFLFLFRGLDVVLRDAAG